MENPLTLNMLVPVSNTVPVNLTIPADYPLNQTELPEPFLGLQNVSFSIYKMDGVYTGLLA